MFLTRKRVGDGMVDARSKPAWKSPSDAAPERMNKDQHQGKHRRHTFPEITDSTIFSSSFRILLESITDSRSLRYLSGERRRDSVEMVLRRTEVLKPGF